MSVYAPIGRGYVRMPFLVAVILAPMYLVCLPFIWIFSGVAAAGGSRATEATVDRLFVVICAIAKIIGAMIALAACFTWNYLCIAALHVRIWWEER
jgi:hypothetical protein